VGTDNRETMDGKRGDPGENVVRLPREWVGPLEDLVPMGSRARASEPDGDARGERDDRSDADAPIPAAGDFWGAGAAAVHDAIQPAGARSNGGAPAGAEAGSSLRARADGGATAAARVQAPRRAAERRRRRARSRRPWGFVAHGAASLPPVRGITFRPRTAAASAAVVSLLTLAAIGMAERGGPGGSVPHRSPTEAAIGGRSHGDPSAAGLLRRGAGAPAHDAPADRTTTPRITTAARARSIARARARRHERARLRRYRERRHRAHRTRSGAGHVFATSGGSGAQPTQPTQPTSTATSPPQTTATEPTSTGPTVTSASGSGSSPTHTTSTHHSAFGAGGLLGAGHSSGAS